MTHRTPPSPSEASSNVERQARVEREFEAHTERDVLAENQRIQSRFPHIFGYPSRQRLFARLDTATAGASGQTVLDYGCGRGEQSLDLLAAGATVHGIDISPIYIETARAAAAAAGYPPERYEFRVMDAHALDFPSDMFDLAIGRGILHHLDPDVALDELHRVLKPDARLLLQEPLADHPLLKVFRRLTPHARTEDEAPFSGADLERLVPPSRWDNHMGFCGLLEAPVAMLTSVVMPSRPQNALLRLADRAERWTHAHRVLLPWNQYVIFDLRKKADDSTVG